MGSYPETSIPIHSGSWWQEGGGGGGSKTSVMSLSTTEQNTQTNDPLC